MTYAVVVTIGETYTIHNRQSYHLITAPTVTQNMQTNMSRHIKQYSSLHQTYSSSHRAI